MCCDWCFPVIEGDYEGPALENDKVTKDFMVKLLQHFKDEKALHRKFAYTVSALLTIINEAGNSWWHVYILYQYENNPHKKSFDYYYFFKHTKKRFELEVVALHFHVIPFHFLAND